VCSHLTLLSDGALRGTAKADSLAIAQRLEFDDEESKNVLVSVDEFCHDEQLQQVDHERWLQDLLSTVDRRQEEHDRRHVLEAAQTNQKDAESLLARFCEESRPKQLGQYERRKK